MPRYKTALELPPQMHAQLVAQGLLPAAANEASFKPTPRKYRNVPVVVDGERFDSKLEWRCREWLRCRCQAGDILWFTRQVPFRLEGGVIYRADFLAALKSGGVEVIDAKGRDTRASANKRKQVLARYGITVMLWPPKR